MGVSRVDYGGSTLMDLTADTVCAEALLKGYTAHGADGEAIEGAAGAPSGSRITLSSSAPTASDGSEGDVWLVGSGGPSSGDTSWDISTNYSTYAGSLSNLKSTSDSTYWWAGNAQSVGQYVLISFASPVVVSQVTFYGSKSGDCPSAGNVLQFSSDGVNWTDAGTFSKKATNTFAGSWPCRYMRMYAKTAASNWLYLDYVAVTAEAAGTEWDYTFTSAYKRGSAGWEALDSLDVLKDGNWSFSG